MPSEATSAMTFDDLVLEVSIFLGTAFYGAAGTLAPAVPTDARDLSEARRTVNNGIRRFIADAPSEGWRWTRPVTTIDIWGAVAVLATRTVTATVLADVTTYTASVATFFESMEQKTISVTGESDAVLETFVSTTVMTRTGDSSFVGSKTFSIAANGDYTLPRDFGGTFAGPITFDAGTNISAPINWTSEGTIRALRADVTTNTGDPRLAAVRPFTPTVGANTRRRWQIALYPTPNSTDQIQFPYDLSFDELTDGTQVHPAPFLHDDTIRASCLARAEMDLNDVAGPMNEDYNLKKENSWRIDRRSAPVRLGNLGSSGAVHPRDVRATLPRQEVTVN